LQLNELNFDRFEAKLDQRITRLDAKWSRMWQELDAKLEQLEAKVHGQIAELDAKWERRAGELRVELNSQRAELIKWMFVFWAGTLVPLAGLMLALML